MKQKLKEEKKNTLVPDILFRMPIKDNVTCKMCKLLLALCLPPLLRPSSEFVLPLQWAEILEKRARGQESHRSVSAVFLPAHQTWAGTGKDGEIRLGEETTASTADWIHCVRFSSGSSGGLLPCANHFSSHVVRGKFKDMCFDLEKFLFVRDRKKLQRGAWKVWLHLFVLPFPELLGCSHYGITICNIDYIQLCADSMSFIRGSHRVCKLIN